MLDWPRNLHETCVWTRVIHSPINLCTSTRSASTSQSTTWPGISCCLVSSLLSFLSSRRWNRTSKAAGGIPSISGYLIFITRIYVVPRCHKSIHSLNLRRHRRPEAAKEHFMAPVRSLRHPNPVIRSRYDFSVCAGKWYVITSWKWIERHETRWRGLRQRQRWRWDRDREASWSSKSWGFKQRRRWRWRGRGGVGACVEDNQKITWRLSNKSSRRRVLFGFYLVLSHSCYFTHTEDVCGESDGGGVPRLIHIIGADQLKRVSWRKFSFFIFSLVSSVVNVASWAFLGRQLIVWWSTMLRKTSLKRNKWIKQIHWRLAEP